MRYNQKINKRNEAMKNQNKIFRLLLGVALIAELCFFLPDIQAQSKCKQWNGEHQQLKFVVVDGKIFGECGSCGDLIPIRSDYGEGAQTVINIKKNSLKVEWLGNIFFCKPYSGIDPGFYGNNPPPDKFWRDDIEIGLREDGILVWRKIGKK